VSPFVPFREIKPPDFVVDPGLAAEKGDYVGIPK
jgi:hypothetical protein